MLNRNTYFCIELELKKVKDALTLHLDSAAIVPNDISDTFVELCNEFHCVIVNEIEETIKI